MSSIAENVISKVAGENILYQGQILYDQLMDTINYVRTELRFTPHLTHTLDILHGYTSESPIGPKSEYYLNIFPRYRPLDSSHDILNQT